MSCFEQPSFSSPGVGGFFRKKVLGKVFTKKKHLVWSWSLSATLDEKKKAHIFCLGRSSLLFKTRKNSEIRMRCFFSSLTFVLFWTTIFFKSRSWGFLQKKSLKLISMLWKSFSRPEEWYDTWKKKWFCHIRKTNAIFWYFHVFYQKSKKNSILVNNVFSFSLHFFKNCLQVLDAFRTGN